jgi:hypothetical protein
MFWMLPRLPCSGQEDKPGLPIFGSRCIEVSNSASYFSLDGKQTLRLANLKLCALQGGPWRSS